MRRGLAPTIILHFKFCIYINPSHKSIITTPEIPPTDETPKVHAFTGICTAIYCPIKFTAKSEQIPCKAVNKNAVKNRFDLINAITIAII